VKVANQTCDLGTGTVQQGIEVGVIFDAPGTEPVVSWRK
jgi:hypothetical protein